MSRRDASCSTDLRERGTVLALVTGNLTRIGWRKLERAGIDALLPLRRVRRNGADARRSGEAGDRTGARAKA